VYIHIRVCSCVVVVVGFGASIRMVRRRGCLKGRWFDAQGMRGLRYLCELLLYKLASIPFIHLPWLFNCQCTELKTVHTLPNRFDANILRYATARRLDPRILLCRSLRRNTPESTRAYSGYSGYAVASSLDRDSSQAYKLRPCRWATVGEGQPRAYWAAG
jgi:hypothetical protein